MDHGRDRRSLHLGLDLGGTFIKWAVVSYDGDADPLDAWEDVDHEQVPTNADDGPERVVQRMAGLAAEVVREHRDIATVGVGVPGSYNRADGTIRELPNFPGAWLGRPMGSVIAAAVEPPVELINDARAFGLAELRLGAGRGVRSMVGFTWGTGLGGVIAFDGRVYQGHDGSAGELGHQTMDPDGPLCNCGNRGCLEAFVRSDQIAAVCGAPDAEQAVERARAGDPTAVAGIADVGRYLGIGLANVVSMFTPDRIVVGGGRSVVWDVFEAHVREQLRLRVRLTQVDQVEIVTASLGKWAGAIGAAIHGAETARAGPPA